MARLLLIAFFFSLWLPVAAFTSGNISFHPPLTEMTALSGPYEWRIDGRDIVREGYRPRFYLYGNITSERNVPRIVVSADFLEWAGTMGGAPLVETGPVYATQLSWRPFVTRWDVEHDAGLTLRAGGARFNYQFLLWGFLSLALPALFWLWMNADRNRVTSPQESWQRDEAFRQKVHDLEIDYKDKPAALRRRTVLLAFLGYGVIWGSILLLVLLGVGLAVVMTVLTKAGGLAAVVVMVPVGFALKLAKSLLSPRYEDAGVPVTREMAPRLFAVLDRIRDKAEGPPFSRVFIITQMNAMVSRHTGWLGFFGFGPVTLSIGLPLMQAMSPGQMEAVIGHEYGHVAAKDNALGQWVYRIRSSWLSLGDRLRTEQLWYALRLNRFYRWFLGFFSAYSFTLSRQCEYEADAFSARMTNRKHTAQALIAMEVMTRRLSHEFWKPIWDKVKLQPEPDIAPYRQMGSFFRAPHDPADALKIIEAAKTNYDSTHPATIDRIRALDETLAPLPPLEKSSATAFLGGLEGELAGLFDRHWRARNRQEWRAAYQQHQRWREKFSALKDRELSQMGRDELTELFQAADIMEDDAVVLAVCQEILRREPDNLAAKVNMLGLRLMTAHDESALLKLDDIMRENTAYLPAACRYALRYFTAQNRMQEAAVYQFRLDEWQYQKQAADEERKTIFAADVLQPHNVMPEYVLRIVGHFKPHKVVGRIYMARKAVQYLPQTPMIVVGIEPSWRTRFRKKKEVHAELQGLIAGLELPPVFHFFIIGSVYGLRAKLRKVPGALVYKR
ncbi:MAG: M48 family metalloprotease [Alphaproteobacteria bacterium]|nr:M48 family metalloprotease [Alphaproteobacteria bacterium]